MPAARPSATPSSVPSDVVDEIFAEAPMITLARLVLLAVALLIVVACLYAVVSIAVRMLRGQWLQRAGGFEPELTEPSGDLIDIASVADRLDEEMAGSLVPSNPHERRGASDDPRRAATD